MSKVLITGVSSGIGRALTKKLIYDGHIVYGIARRLELLKSLKKEIGKSKNFIYSKMNVINEEDWLELISKMKRKKFVPEAVVLNAAINDVDLNSTLNTKITKKIFDVNFFGVLLGVETLLSYLKPHSQIIVISSLSGLKGSSIEGIGYPASKAALSIAFESLHQKFGKKYIFKTIHFGPVASGMGPFERKFPIILSEQKAVEVIIRAMKEAKSLVYSPRSLFLVLKIMKLLPTSAYFMLLSLIESTHLRLRKKYVKNS